MIPMNGKRETPDAGRGLRKRLEQVLPGLTRFCLRLCRGDEHKAADVLQETVERILRYGATYRASRGGFFAWSRKVAYRTFLRLGERERRTVPVEADELEDMIRGGRHGDFSAEERLDLASALERLDETSRNIVVLFHLEGMSCAEIADLLSMGVSAVKVRLMRARRRLSRMLEPGRGR